jgi:hypothetical protein
MWPYGLRENIFPLPWRRQQEFAMSPANPEKNGWGWVSPSPLLLPSLNGYIPLDGLDSNHS